MEEKEGRITITLMWIRFVLSFFIETRKNSSPDSLSQQNPFTSTSNQLSCPFLLADFIIYSKEICFQFFILISETNLTCLIFMFSVSCFWRRGRGSGRLESEWNEMELFRKTFVKLFREEWRKHLIYL